MTKSKEEYEEIRKSVFKVVDRCIKRGHVKEDAQGNKWTDTIFIPRKLMEKIKGVEKVDGFGTVTLYLTSEILKKYGIGVKTIAIAGKKGTEKDDRIRICSLVTRGRIIEEIYKDKTATFIVYDPTDGIKTVSEIGPYIPRVDDLLKKGTILLPGGIEDYGTPEKLKNGIKEFIHEYVDIPEEFEELSTYYILLTWVYDKLETIPYLRPIGDTTTGKSRFLKVIGGLCYHKTSIAGAVTPAPIYRVIEQWKPTLIIDEGDIRSSNEKNEIVTILNCGFERENPVIRCNRDDPDKLESHEVFGPKLIATRYRFEDNALESRCITVEMRPTGRDDIPILLPKKFYEKRGELQKKLLKFRLDTYYLIDSDVSEKLQKELHKDIDKRLLQATGPLLCLTNIPGLDTAYKEFIETYNIKLIEERGNSTTGVIVNALFDLIKMEEESKGTQDLKITPGDVATYITEKLKRDISNAKVGKELKAVGIESKRKWNRDDKKTERILTLKPELLEEIQLKYRLPEERSLQFLYSTDRTVGTDRGAMGIPDFLEKEECELEHESRSSYPNSTDRPVRPVRKKPQRNISEVHETRDQKAEMLYLLDTISGLDKGDGTSFEEIMEKVGRERMTEKFVRIAIEEFKEMGDLYEPTPNKFKVLRAG